MAEGENDSTKGTKEDKQVPCIEMNLVCLQQGRHRSSDLLLATGQTLFL